MLKGSISTNSKMHADVSTESAELHGQSTPAELTGKHWKTQENEGRPEHRQERTRGNETQADAKGNSAKRAHTGQPQATQQTPPAQHTTHPTQTHATARPNPPPTSTRGQQDKRKVCRASMQLIRVSFGPAQLCCSVWLLARLGPHWTCSAGTQLCSHALSRMDHVLTRHASWTTRWV